MPLIPDPKANRRSAKKQKSQKDEKPASVKKKAAVKKERKSESQISRMSKSQSSGAKPKAKSKVKTGKSESKKPVRKKLKKNVSSRRKKVLVVLGVLLVVLAGAGWSGFTNANTMYLEALAAKDSLDNAQAAFTEQRFVDAQGDLEEVVTHLEASKQASDNLVWMKWIPWVSTQFKAVDHIIAGGIHGAEGAIHVAVVADTIFSAVDSEDASLSTIGPKKRKELLKAFSESTDTLRLAQEELSLSLDEFEQIPTEGVVAPLAVVIGPLKEQLPLIEQLVEKALPFLEVAPQVVGYPEEQTYLLLLQNNTELRATGGFIGSIGILKLKNGDIKDFKIDNVYNLDYAYRDNDDAPKVAPPEPISRYLSIYEWYLRDSNWHPHFPRSAEKAIEFYHLEDGPEPKLDGVIAIDQGLIKSLLTITGPVVAEGDEYTPDNLDELLHHKVEVSFEEDGRTNASRKDIIPKLGDILMDKMMSLPKSQWGVAFEVLLADLDEKSILLYFEDDYTQLLTEQLGWAGAIQAGYEGDYLMVVDSNLGALKTDRVMVRDFTYTVREENGEYLVDLVLNYTNNGVFDFFTSRYNSYTRIYVPRGSELIDSSGFRTHDRNVGGEEVQALVTQDDIVNRTVFEGFISIEPQTSNDITLTYKLPQAIAEQIREGEYRLYWQKQPGTENITSTVDITFGEDINGFTGVDGWEQTSNNTVRLNRALDTDGDLTVEFK